MGSEAILSWWHFVCGREEFPGLASCWDAWAKSLEARAGGTFVIKPGAEFGASHLWWGRRRPRQTLHEGVDFQEVLKDGSVEQLLPGFWVPAIADGVVVAVFDDFLARTVVMRHSESILSLSSAGVSDRPSTTEPWQLCTLFAHVEPQPGVVPGRHVCAPGGSEAEAESVASIAVSKTAAPPHLHVSMLAAPVSFPWATLSGWPELLKRSAAREAAFLEPPPLGGAVDRRTTQVGTDTRARSRSR